MLFSLQYGAYFSGSGAASRSWINGVWKALRPYASGQAYQNYIDPQLTTWQRAYYASNLRAPARDQAAGRPGLHVPLPPGDPAGELMDRESLRRLRAQPGYLPFVSAATLARVSDEMFSVGVVLLVLDRTDSASLAGLAVAAITLPSLISGPLLGAWLDLTGRRRWLMVLDQLLISTMLVVLVAASPATRPTGCIPLVVLMAGLTYPLSFGGFTSFIPVIVPDDLLAPANALETTSFNSALVVGPALAGTLSGAFGPATSLLVEAALALVALVLILRIPGLDRGGRRGDGRTLLGVAAAGHPPDRLDARAARHHRRRCDRPRRAGADDGRVPAVRGRAPRRRAQRRRASCGPRSRPARRSARSAWCGSSGASRRERIVLAGYAVFGVLMLTWPLAGSLPRAAGADRRRRAGRRPRARRPSSRCASRSCRRRCTARCSRPRPA